jgi:hypothetical protein
VPSDGGFEVSLELLRRGHSVKAMVELLGRRLERALPSHVDYRSSRFGRKASLVVKLIPQQFRLEVSGHRASAWVDHIVRDVRVRSDEMHMDEWIAALARSLEREAERSTSVRIALEDALA